MSNNGKIPLEGRAGAALNTFAVCASFTCMMHCLALPLLFAVLPAIADRVDPGENFHAAVILLALPMSALALVGGWRRHRTYAPLAAGVVGLTLIAVGIALARREAIETVVTVTGSLLLAGAHIMNWQRRSAVLA